MRRHRYVRYTKVKAAEAELREAGRTHANNSAEAFLEGSCTLRVHIYTSTRFSRKYDHWKTSIHLVLHQIVVDETRAATLRQHCLEVLETLNNPKPDNAEGFKGLVPDGIARDNLDKDPENNTWTSL